MRSKNNEQSEIDTVILGVPKAQFPNPLCIIFSTTISFLIPKASVHNFVYDNILASFASTLKELLPILECEAAIKLLHNNRMTVTLDKFQVILLHKKWL